MPLADVNFGDLLLLVFEVFLFVAWIWILVAIISAKLDQVDSLETLLGFEEVSYMALFGWLAVAGPGPISLDYLLQKLQSNPKGALATTA